jgi:hypothetical protein
MGFGKGLTRGLAVFTALGITVAASSGFAQTTKQTKAPVPTPATERGPSNVDLVNKALNPGASNPDVPLPHPDLANSSVAQSGSRTGPQIYGRQEEGGGVLGLRMPFPADRNSTGRSY